MANEIEITMLGKFEITANGKPVLTQLEQSRKATLLVQYLLLENERCIPHDELTRTLWGGSAAGNPDMALRAIMHRFRGMAVESGIPELERCIITRRGSYQWNPELKCTVDVFTVRTLLEHAGYETSEEARCTAYEQAISLYNGKLLPASAGEPWVERRSVELHSQYQGALYALLELYKKREDYNSVITVCRRALEVDEFDEHLYMELVVALEHTGQTKEAQRVSRNAANLGYRHMSEHRPRDLGISYNRFLQADCRIESDINTIYRELNAAVNNGSFVCDYPVFCEIYQLNRRMNQRFGIPLFLGVVTVAGPTEDEAEDSVELAGVMDRLEKIMKGCLRSCDVVARYSASQYVVLLAGAGSECSINPMERIKKEFYSNPAHGDYAITYRVKAPSSN